jgi:hypothetical protein
MLRRRRRALRRRSARSLEVYANLSWEPKTRVLPSEEVTVAWGERERDRPLEESNGRLWREGENSAAWEARRIGSANLTKQAAVKDRL